MNVFIFAISFITAAMIVVPLGIAWQLPLNKLWKLLFVDALITGIILNIVSHVTGTTAGYGGALVSFFLNGGLTLVILVFLFFRDPERESPNLREAILSPADGRIVYVKKIDPSGIPVSEKRQKVMVMRELKDRDFLSRGGYLIGIGMSVMNVHVNRSPIAGTVEMIKRKPGKFLSLKKEEAMSENERVITVVNNGSFKIGIIQIASRLVRRIVSYVREGDRVSSGQRIGMIKFGSQVDVVIPRLDDLSLNVGVGDEVVAGMTILAKHNLKSLVNIELEKMAAEECSQI